MNNRRVNEDIDHSIIVRTHILLAVIVILAGVLFGRIFYLQIVHGEDTLQDFTLRIQKERTINSTRGKIYDRNGNVLAYNELAYNVTIEDVYESGSTKNRDLNNTLIKAIDVIEANGDKIIGDFNIVLNEDNEFVFTVSGTGLKRFLADVYGYSDIGDLKYEEETATANDVINYLCSYGRFGIGESSDPDNPRDSFVAGKGYSKKQILDLINIRYAMSLSGYQKYIPTVIATDVSNETVATLMENSDDLLGISIEENNIRKYNDSVYFSQILGYTGKISEEELEEFNTDSEPESETVKQRNDYVLTDMVGKAGIEKNLETYLQGVKGSETVYVNNLGKVIESTKTVDPVAGNDVYLTIDRDLQIAVYNILEQKLAGILVTKISNIKEYKPPEGIAASKYEIPITDVYFALFNNSIIDINHMGEKDAKEYEQKIYTAYLDKEAKVYEKLRSELVEEKTPYKDLTDEYQIYESYIVTMLNDLGVIVDSKVDKNDQTYINWRSNETISLNEYLNYLIAMNWIDATKLDLDEQYSDSQEVYARMVDYIIEHLDKSSTFSKRLFKYMILKDEITGYQIVNVLLEQDAVSITQEEEQKFLNGSMNAYNFILYLIENLYLSPGELALDPYSASCVITNTQGEVLALVSYPSYDNNKLANSIDSAYYAKLQSDLSRPLWNYATQLKTAPGSTYKMVSATAALEEGIINAASTVTCRGYFDRFQNEQYNCWVYPGAHGTLNVTGAIENSCNSFFYEMGYRLSLNQNDVYNEDLGLEKLAKYADMYGLTEKSGVEIEESEPEVSDEYPVLSAIGQGSNNFTTVGLARYVTTIANNGTCYNLSLVDRIDDASGNLIKDINPTVRNTVDLPNAYWNCIHTGMRRVVEKKSYYQNLGVTVAGKTGTAQETKLRTNHALFISYAPYIDPEITVSTRIAYGYTSEYAANLTRDIYKYYFKLEDEDDILTGTAAIPDAVITGGD